MIDKKIFFENLKTFLIAFNFEFKNENDLKLYTSCCYGVFINKNINQEQFINGIKKIINTKKRSEMYGRPAPMDLIEMMKLEKQEISPERQAGIEFLKIMNKIRGTNKEPFNEITEQVLKTFYKNGISSIYWMMNDPWNDNKIEQKWIKKEFIENYLNCYDKKEQEEQENKNLLNNDNNKQPKENQTIANEINNLIDDITKKTA